MRLEQQLYKSTDLKNLSASALYTGHLPPMGPGGFGVSSGKDSYGFKIPIFTRDGEMNSDEIGMYSPLKIQPKADLTIRDLPFSGTALHIHEEEGGISHFKHRDGTYSEISSYDAAMADGGKPAYDAMEVLEQINKSMTPQMKENIRKIFEGRIFEGKSEE